MMKAALTTLATALLTLVAGAGVISAQDGGGGKTCTYAGNIYQPGDTVTVDGRTMTCDGSTGEWVEVEQ